MDNLSLLYSEYFMKIGQNFLDTQRNKMIMNKSFLFMFVQYRCIFLEKKELKICNALIPERSKKNRERQRGNTIICNY